jgi:hypothetical protein
MLDGKSLPISPFFTNVSVPKGFATEKRLSGRAVIAVDSKWSVLSDVHDVKLSGSVPAERKVISMGIVYTSPIHTRYRSIANYCQAL